MDESRIEANQLVGLVAQKTAVEHWLEVVAPDEPHRLQRRLEWDELELPEFECWLQASPSDVEIPASCWQAGLDICRKTLQAKWQLPLLPYSPQIQRPFQDIWWPLRLEMEGWLIDEFQLSNKIESSVFSMLSDSLIDRLCHVTESALWSQFRLGRTPGSMLLAHLGNPDADKNAPSRDLYEDFVKRQRREGLASLLTEFPVLARLIGSVIHLWQTSTMEMLSRIINDRSALEQTFGIPIRFHLVSVQQGLSDPHQGGRVVSILHFKGQDDARVIRVVYKPKEMGVDSAYQDLLHDLNIHSSLEPLRILSVLTRSSYGYMEYVCHQPCESEESLQRFYTNAGRVTAILHILGCTDCHHENLIASGEELLLVDTETLLEPELPHHSQDAASDSRFMGPSSLRRRFFQSVLRSGLLPQWIFVGANKVAVDISALGISPPSSAEKMVTGWLGINSDGMLPGRISRTSTIPTSLPVGIGSINPFHRFLNEFCEGFSSQAHVLIAQRERWLHTSSVLNNFAGLIRRSVLRNTRVYYALQRQQLSPDALRSHQNQALTLEELSRSFLLAQSKPNNWPVFDAERRQMQQLDIPFFTHTIDGDALRLDNHGNYIDGFFCRSGLESARQRLARLDHTEIDFQLKLIRGTVQARQLRAEAAVISEEDQNDSANSTQVPTLLHAASQIGEQLLRLAIHDQHGRVDWLGIDLGRDGESFYFGLVGSSLYGGSIGVACLLDQLDRQDIEIFGARKTKEAIIRTFSEFTEHGTEDSRRRWWRNQSLGLNGCGGVLLGLQQLGELNIVDQLVDTALPRFINADEQLDMIGGCAGLIGALLRSNNQKALDIAIVAGEHLVKRQNESGGWSVNRQKRPLLGFSHGTAGYAAALANLYRHSGYAHFAEAAQSALAYERSRFNSSKRNWPDFRVSTGANQPDGFRIAWCHGAPGIGLSRACLWGTELWDDECTEEITNAIKTTSESSAFRSDHLCCGSLGLMVILELLANGPWEIESNVRTQAINAASVLRASALQRCVGEEPRLRGFGTRDGNVVLPGFFTGLSGMGLALLGTPESRLTVETLLCGGLNLSLKLANSESLA